MSIKLKVITNDTCGCCKTYIPKLEQIQKEYPIEIEYLNINDTDMDLSVYDFKGVPFTIVYNNGRYHHHYQGDMPIERIKEQLGIN